MPILFLLLLTLSATLHAAPPVTIDRVNDRDATVLVATNSGHAPVHIQLTFTQLLYAHLSPNCCTPTCRNHPLTDSLSHHAKPWT